MKLFIAKNVMKTDLALLTPQSGVFTAGKAPSMFR